MSTLFNLLLFTTLLAFGSSDEVDELNGDWTMIRVMHVNEEIYDRRHCFTFKITTTTEQDKCGDKNVPVIVDRGGDLPCRVPVIFVKTQVDVSEAVKAKCENHKNHYVIHRLSDNYMTVDDSRGKVTILLAKTIPAAAELEEFLKKQGLHERTGPTYCTKEVLDEAKNSK